MTLARPARAPLQTRPPLLLCTVAVA